MKTKAQIVGELLKDGKINAEEAVVLLTPEYVNSYPNYIPYIPSYPTYPSPFWYGSGTAIANLCNDTLTNN